MFFSQNAIKVQIRDKFKNNRKPGAAVGGKKRPAEGKPAERHLKKRKVVGFPNYFPAAAACDEAQELKMLTIANKLRSQLSEDPAEDMNETFEYRRHLVDNKKSVDDILSLFPLLGEKEQVRKAKCAPLTLCKIEKGRCGQPFALLSHYN